MKGLRNVLERRRFVIPPSVQAATAKFRTEADPLRSFIEDHIEGAPRQSLARQEVYHTYAAWAANNGFQPLSASRFYESLMHLLAELIPHEVAQRRRADGRYITGIKLTNIN